MTTDLLLSQAIEGFFIARRADGYSPKTLYQYDWALKMLLEMGDLPLKQIDTEYLRRFMASVQQKPSLSSSSVFHIWYNITCHLLRPITRLRIAKLVQLKTGSYKPINMGCNALLLIEYVISRVGGYPPVRDENTV